MAELDFPKSNGDVLFASEANRFAGFGDGSDGAFNETSGTTNLIQGTVYQYTTFNLGASATISASSTSAYPIIIYVQGDVTIEGTINLVGKGQPAATGYSLSSTNGIMTAGLANTSGTDVFGNNKTMQGGYSNAIFANFYLNQASVIFNGTGGGAGVNEGSGGGGASTTNRGTTGSLGTGGGGSATPSGAGGCTILLICGGDLTFGASAVINTSGESGTAGDTAGSVDNGGGGGGSGDILIFYNGALTDGGVTKTTNGGAGGAAANSGSAGGAGGDGFSKVVAYETIFWGR